MFYLTYIKRKKIIREKIKERFLIINKDIDNEIPWKFVHITKNGGTAFCLSLENSMLCCDNNDNLCEDGSHHLKLRDYRDNYNFIAIVRNPYNRFVSAFSHTRYLSKNSRYYNEQEFKRHLKFKKYNNVNHFVDYLTFGDQDTIELFKNHSHFHTQTEFLNDEKYSQEFSSKLKILLKLENINKDIEKLKKFNIHVTLPNNEKDMNKTKYPKLYLTYNTKNFIESYYKSDFVNLKKHGFNYTTHK